MSNPRKDQSKDQIRGWKEIAAYFDRDERTVKRWEKQRALPVRRIPGEGRANVYIVISDAEAWLAAGNHIADLPPAGRSRSETVVAQAGAGHPRAPQTPTQTGNPSGNGSGNSAPSPATHAGLSDQSAPLHREEYGEPLRPRPDSHLSAAASGVRAVAALLAAAAVLLLAGTLLRRHLPAGSDDASAPSHANSPHANIARSATQKKADALYLQGVYFNEQRTPKDLKQAVDSFQDAIALDPGHAHAYAGLAMTYLLLREYGTMPDSDAYVKAEAAAQKALALDPNLPEAHASLGFVAFFSSWNSPLATREFSTALHQDSGCVVAHHWYGSMLMHQGMYVEALQQLDIAQQLAPTSAPIRASKAYALGLAGRREEALQLLQPLVTSNTAVASPHRILATLSLLPPRDIPRYLAEMRRFAEIRNSHDTANTVDTGAAAFRRGGERQMWSAMLAREKQLHPSADRPTYFMAEAESALGFEDEAIREISILAKQHDPAIIGIDIDPLFDPLRHNPRFQDIVTLVGLPPRA